MATANLIVVKAWLESNNCTEVTPVKVTIGQEQFNGCSYKQEGDTEKLYLLGSLPRVKHPRGQKYPKDGICFTYEGKDWYVAYYMLKENINEQNKEFHPFGLAFGVFCWNCDTAIDKWEEKPYKRYPMKIETLE